jgi:hypothetical protein
MAQELLDFEAPLALSSYEKFINNLEAKSNYFKLAIVALCSFFSAAIVYYKATPSEITYLEIMIVAGGFFILLMAIGFLLRILLIMTCAIIELITNSISKIGKLGTLSITLLLSFSSVITLSILAIFID